MDSNSLSRFFSLNSDTQVNDTLSVKTVVHKWRRPVDLFLLIIALTAIPGIKGAGYLSVYFSGILAVFLYVMLAHILNKTTVEIAGNLLSIKHGPLPWPGRRAVPLSRIRSVFQEEQATRKTGFKTYNIGVLLDNGQTIILLRRFDDYQLVWSIIRKLEKWIRSNPRTE